MIGLRSYNIYVFGALGLCFSPASAQGAAFQVINHTEINESFRRNLQFSLDGIQEQLPPTLQQLVRERRIQIVFAAAKTPQTKAWISLRGLWSSLRRSRTIYLNQNLITESPQPEHFSIIVGLVVHELAHIYDLSARFMPEERALWLRCQQDQLQRTKHESVHQHNSAYLMSPSCRELEKKTRLVSDSYRYQKLAGFQAKHFNKNLSDARAADPYEMVSASEHFAENFRFFILDPEYQCRRPAFYRFFSQHFGAWEPQHPKPDCPLRFRVNGRPDIVSIERHRVFELQYLLAGEGSGIESRFGHSLVRLVICRPGRKLGMGCRLDREFHLTVALLGDVHDLRMNPLKGLFGRYQSSFQIETFRNTLKDYNQEQFRTVSSYPIRIRRTELLQFVDLLSEKSWEYRGKYFFIGRNCASELGDLMRAAFDSEGFLYDSNQSPRGLLRSLVRHSLVDHQDFEFFPSYRDTLQEHLAQLSAEIPVSIPWDHFTATTPEARWTTYQEWTREFDQRLVAKARALAEANQSRDALATYLVIPAVLSLIESHLAERALKTLANRKQRVLVRYIEKGRGLEDQESSEELREQFSELRKLKRERSSGSLPTFLGYGIPLSEDLLKMSEIFSPQIERIRELTLAIGLALDAKFPEETKSVRAHLDVHKLLVKALKERALSFKTRVLTEPSVFSGL